MAAVTEAVLGLPAAGDDLCLGGANALAEYYLGHRVSVDLDFFAMEPGRVEAASWSISSPLTESSQACGPFERSPTSTASRSSPRREAPFAIADRLSQIGDRLPVPLPPSLKPVDPDEIQRWFADEATAMWRRIRPERRDPA